MDPVRVLIVATIHVWLIGLYNFNDADVREVILVR